MIPSLYQELGTFGFEPFTTGQTVWDFSPKHTLTQYISESWWKQLLLKWNLWNNFERLGDVTRRCSRESIIHIILWLNDTVYSKKSFNAFTPFNHRSNSSVLNGPRHVQEGWNGWTDHNSFLIDCASIWPCLRGRWLTQWTLVQRCGSTSRRWTSKTVDVVEGICDAPLGLKKLDQVFDQRIWWGSSGEFDLGHIV